MNTNRIWIPVQPYAMRWRRPQANEYSVLVQAVELGDFNQIVAYLVIYSKYYGSQNTPIRGNVCEVVLPHLLAPTEA